jgi:hypothetical protein
MYCVVRITSRVIDNISFVFSNLIIIQEDSDTSIVIIIGHSSSILYDSAWEKSNIIAS